VPTVPELLVPDAADAAVPTTPELVLDRADPAGPPAPVLVRNAQELRLHATDGTAIVADVRAGTPEGAAVVLVHGFGSHRRERTVLAVADALHAAGHSVVSVDLRGHGESEGLCTLGDLERHDVAAAAALAAELSSRVVLVGASMGAIAVLHHAALDAADLAGSALSTVAGVVTVSSPARWRLHTPRTVAAAFVTRTSLGRRLGRHLGVRLAASWRLAASPQRLAASLAAPLAVVHGTADRFMPASEATLLYAAATGRRRLDLVEGMGHAYDPAGTATLLAGVAWCLQA